MQRSPQSSARSFRAVTSTSRARARSSNIAAEPANGARTFETDATHRVIVSETFTKIPSTYVIRRSGWVPGKVALTFDDGPSSDWTPKILDILKQKGVKATFFIVGDNGETNPEPRAAHPCRGS